MSESKVTIEIETKEALYTVNSISAIQRAIRKAAKHDRAYYERTSSLEALKQKLMGAMKEQSNIEDLREGIKIIDNDE